MTSKIVVNNIEADAGISTVTVIGDCQATTFKGDGSNLTALPAANLTGTLPALDGSALTGVGVGTDGSVSTSGIITATTFNYTGNQNFSNRNLIINGSFLIAQRATTSTSDNYQTVDRFACSSSVDADNGELPTQAQVDVSSSDTPFTLGLTKAFKITNGNQTSGAGASYYMRIRHRIEAQDVRNSGWNYKSSSSYITISFWVKSSVAQTFYLNIRSNDGTGQAYAHPFSATTSWTKITHSIPGNSNLDFANDNGIGLEMQWAQYYGTQYTDNSRADNTWATFNSASQTKDQTTTWFTTNDATFELTGVQLEVGPVATPFEHRSFADQLDRCLRYCYVINVKNVDIIDCNYGYCYTTSNVKGSFYLPKEMRIYPTYTGTATDVNFYAANNSAYFHLDDITGVLGSDTSPHPNTYAWTVTTSSVTAGQAGVLLGREDNGKITFDAEL